MTSFMPNPVSGVTVANNLSSVHSSPIPRSTTGHNNHMNSSTNYLLDEETKLLTWVQNCTRGYEQVRAEDFCYSWADGWLFNILLHCHQPELLSIELVSSMTALERVHHAFNLLQHRLNITIIISSEDINLSQPDSNAVQLFVVTIYQMFVKPSTMSRTAPGAHYQDSEVIKTQSTLRSIEETITWMSEVQTRISSTTTQLNEAGTILHETRAIFHSTEDFFSDLSYQNMEIINLISQASELLFNSNLSTDNGPNSSTKLLALKVGWECVRAKALDLQSRIQNTLMTQEKEEIETVGEWLTTIEDRIDKITNIPGNFEIVDAHIEELKSIQAALEFYQARINDLGNAVILVDENENTQEIEEELNLLGDRWAKICKWTEERWDLLQVIHVKWGEFFEGRDNFSSWLSTQTKTVNELFSKASEKQVSTENGKDYFKLLKSLEVEMENKQDEFSALGETSTELCKYNENDDSFKEVQTCIISLAEQWDDLVQRMEELGEVLSKSEVFASKVVETSLPKERLTEVKTNVTTTETVNSATDNELLNNVLDIDQMNSLSENAVKSAFILAARDLEDTFNTGGRRLDFSFNSSNDPEEEPESIVDGSIQEHDSNSCLASPVEPELRPDSPLASLMCEPDDTLVRELAAWLDSLAPEISAITQGAASGNKLQKFKLESLSEKLNDRAAEVYALASSESASALRSKFNSILSLVSLKEKEVSMLISQKELISEIELLEKQAGDISEWTNVQEPIGIEQTKIKEQLDQCQSKYWEVQKHRQRLSALQTSLDNVGPQLDVIARKSFLSRTKHLKLNLDKSMTWLENRDKRLTMSLDNTPPQRYSDAISELATYLDELKSRFDSMGQHVVCDINTMDDNLQTCKSFQSRVSDMVQNYNYVKTSVEDVYQRCSDPIKADFFRSQNKETCDKWVKFTKKLDDRTAQLEKWLKVFRKFNEEVGGLNSWMDQVYMFLHSEEAALGDVATVSAQYEQSKALEEDISTIKPNLATILEIGHQLIERASPKYGRKLRSSLDTLQKKWDKTVKLTKQQTLILETALEKSRMLEDSLIELKSFLEDMSDKQIPQKLDITSLDEIPELVTEYSKILESIASHEHLVKKIESVYSEIVRQDLLDGLEDLMQRVSTVNASWLSLKQHVQQTHINLSKSHENYSELMKSLTTRTSWLLQVKEVLEVTPKEVTGDAEDISEKLDALERVLDDEPMSAENVEELAASLSKSGILVEEVSDTTEKLNDLVESIEKPAKKLKIAMEVNLSNVQMIERDILDVQDWLTATDRVIQDFLEAGVFSDSVPDDFKELSSEFQTNQEKVNEIGLKFNELTLTSSDRIQQQLTLLRKEMDELLTKFNKFQKPADFETKRLYVVSQLGTVMHALESADVKDWDEVYLQKFLDAHENYYKILSDLKPEVEYVLKVGFSIIENGQADALDELESSLNDIKNQFNELGAQVTAGKGMFESALYYSRRISANLIEMTEWLEQMDRDLRNKSINVTMDDLLYDLQVHERDMKIILHDTEEVLDLAEPNPLHSLESTVESANQRFKDMAHRIAEYVSTPGTCIAPEMQIQPEVTRVTKSSTGPTPDVVDVVIVNNGEITWYNLVNEIRKWMVGADKELTAQESQPSEVRGDANELSIYDELKRQLKEQEVKKKDLKKMANEDKANGDTRVDSEIKMFNSQFNNVSLRIHTAKATETKINFTVGVLGPFGSSVSKPVSAPAPTPVETPASSASPSVDEPVTFVAKPVPVKVTSQRVMPAMAIAQEHLEIEQELANLQKQTEGMLKTVQAAIAAASEEEKAEGSPSVSTCSLEDLDQQWSTVDPRAKALISRGMKLVSEIMKTNPNKGATLRNKLDRFKNECDTIRKHKNLAVEKEWYAFKREVQNFEIFVFEFERKAKQTKGNLTKLSLLYADFLQFRQEFAELNFKARELLAKGSTNEVTACLAKLTNKWRTVDSYFEWFDHEEVAPEHAAQQEGVKHFMVQAYPTMFQIAEVEGEVSSLELFLSDYTVLQKQLDVLDRFENKITSTDYEVKNVDLLAQNFLDTAEIGEKKEIERVIYRIKTDWNRVKRSFEEKKQQFDHSVDEVQVLSDFLKVLTAWVTKAEAFFQSTRLHSGKLNIPKAQTEQIVLESEMKMNTQVFDSLISRSANLSRLSNSLDTTVLGEKIEAFERRWVATVTEINQRHEQLKNYQPTMEKFLKEIDALLTWVKSVSETLTCHPPGADVEKLEVYLDTLKAYLKELEAMNDRIQDINEMGKQLIVLNPSDLELIEAKLRELNPKYVSVSHSVLKASHDVEIQLQETKEFSAAMSQLESWIGETSKFLDDTATGSDLSIVSELKNSLDDKLKLLNIVNSFDRVNDVDFRERVTHVNNLVNIIADKISNSQPSTMELQSLLRQSRMSKKSREQVSSGHDKFDSITDEIRDWLIILQHLLKSEMVTVGDVNHIRNLIAKQKQILNEPMSVEDKDLPYISPDQGDELTKCLSSIQSGLQFIQAYLIDLNTPDSVLNEDDSMKVGIMNKVNSIKTEWEECRVQVLDRCRHLEILLQASETFLNIYDNCRNDLCNTEYKLTHFGEVGFSSRVLKRQIASQKVLKDEIKVLRKTVEALVRLSNKIISDFSQDNTSKIREMRDSVYTNWKRVLKNSEMLDHGIRQNVSEIDHLTKNANELLIWMRDIEVQIDCLALETSGDLMDNEAQYFQWQVQCKEFQLEIANHRIMWHAVETACKKGLKALEPGDEFDISYDALEELTSKWASIKLKVKQIRQKLNINMEHCSQLLLALTKLNDWSQSHLKELEKLPAVSGNLDKIQELYDKFIIDRSHISKKQKMIEANIDLGKQYVLELEDMYSRVSADLESLPDRRGSIISTGSDDSPESAKEVMSNINGLTMSLNNNWELLTKKVETRGREISEMLKTFQSFNAVLDNLHKKLHEADNLRYRWSSIGNLRVEGVPEELEVIKDFETHLVPLKENLDSLTTKSRSLQISADMKTKLSTCADKWKEIKTSTDARKNKLNTLLKEFGPHSQAHLANSVAAPWERTVAPNKVPFYINHKTESTQWDHPKYTEFMDGLGELNGVRFSAYRTAMKLTKLEAFLNFETVDLKQVIAAIDKQDFKNQDTNSFIDVADIINCLNSVFQAVANKKKNQVKLSFLVDIALNFILNVYDAARNGKIRILSLKVVLGTLARCNLDDKYKFLFQLVAPSASGSVSGSDLGRLLHDIMQIPRQLGEIASFGGSNIEPSVRSCLSLSKSKNGADMNTFLEWMKCEPQSLVWLPVLFRMQNAENARHQAKCNICKAFPIVGFRYRCLKCFNFDMCQTCFLAGKSHKSHKLSHPMQEYCSACNTSEDVKALAKVFKNRFTTKKVRKRNSKLGYLPVQSVKEGGNIESPLPQETPPQPEAMHTRIELYSSRIADAEMNRSQSSMSNYSHPSSIVTITPSNEPISPQQLMLSMDKQEAGELEMLISSLETENQALLEEYELHKEKRCQIATTIDNVSSQTVMVSEAQQLYTDKYKLENRMKVLEDQNRQLEAQLERLKKLLAQPAGAASLSVGGGVGNNLSTAVNSFDSCSPSSSFHSLDSGRASSRNYHNNEYPSRRHMTTNAPIQPRSAENNHRTLPHAFNNGGSDFTNHVK